MFSFQKDEALARGLGFEDAEIQEDKETNALEIVVVRLPDKDSRLATVEKLAVNDIQLWLARVSWCLRRYSCNHLSVGLQQHSEMRRARTILIESLAFE